MVKNPPDVVGEVAAGVAAEEIGDDQIKAVYTLIRLHPEEALRAIIETLSRLRNVKNGEESSGYFRIVHFAAPSIVKAGGPRGTLCTSKTEQDDIIRDLLKKI